MIEIIKRYNIDDFQRISSNGSNYKLDSSVLENIQKISAQVSDPKYIRTPHFQKKGRTDKSGNKIGKETTNQLQDNDNWNNFRQFKITKIEKKEGIEKTIDEIRKFLNKISIKNYENQRNNIIQKLHQILHDNTSDNNVISDTKEFDGNNAEKNSVKENFGKVGFEIYSIASGNMFFSEMYAQLYKDLMDEFPQMKVIFHNNLMLFREIFKKIDFCSANEDYDKFCAINKDNEKRRASGLFYVNLMKIGVITRDEITNIIKDLQNYQMLKIVEPDNKHIIDELSEVIYIIVTNSISYFKNEIVNNEWKEIIEKITKYSLMKVSDKPSITSKSIFKHMDILDAIEKVKNS